VSKSLFNSSVRLSVATTREILISFEDINGMPFLFASNVSRSRSSSMVERYPASEVKESINSALVNVKHLCQY
jgi:hypothetical protein